MPQIIQFLADMLGIEYNAVEGSVVTISLLIAAFLVKLLWAASRRDDKQLDLEKTLATLAVRTLKSYDKNTEAIQQVCDVLNGMKVSITEITQEMKTSFAELVSELKTVGEGVDTLIERSDTSQPTLESIKESLDKLVRVRVLIKDTDGTVLATLHAKPDANGNLVVIYTARHKKQEAVKHEPPQEVDT